MSNAWVVVPHMSDRWSTGCSYRDTGRIIVQVFKCMSDQSHCTVSIVDLYINVSGKYQLVVYSVVYLGFLNIHILCAGGN